MRAFRTPYPVLASLHSTSPPEGTFRHLATWPTRRAKKGGSHNTLSNMSNIPNVACLGLDVTKACLDLEPTARQTQHTKKVSTAENVQGHAPHHTYPPSSGCLGAGGAAGPNTHVLHSHCPMMPRCQNTGRNIQHATCATKPQHPLPRHPLPSGCLEAGREAEGLARLA